MTSKAKTESKGSMIRRIAHLTNLGRDNEFIFTGYRRASYSHSYLDSFISIFAVYNGTGTRFYRKPPEIISLECKIANIWSHLLGATFFACTLYQCLELGIDPNAARTQDVVAQDVYNLSVAVCFVHRAGDVGHGRVRRSTSPYSTATPIRATPTSPRSAAPSSRCGPDPRARGAGG
ncbi:hypothetical protein GGR53DRAFT_212043 [Hypoxylon sp. FL1150]|nr:hypothetical protein GGR53DRAFT_212043 [Hypoxylon sp. FL1150]